VSGVSGNLEQLLHSNKLDMALLFQPEPQGLQVEWLFQEALYLVAPPSLAVPDPFPLARTADTLMLLPSPNLGLRTLIDSALARHGIRPNIVAELDGSIPTLCTAIEHGLGCSIMPWAAFSDSAARGEVAGYPLTPEMWRPVSLCRSAAPAASRASQVVFERMRRLIREDLRHAVEIGSIRLQS